MFSLQYARVRLYTEVSKTGRWHFHGFINIKDRLRFTIKDLKKLLPFGTVCIKRFRTTDDYANWLAYCHKQQNDIGDYLTNSLFCILDPRLKKLVTIDDTYMINNIGR